MTLKILLLAILVVFTTAYTEQGNVLVLTDEDFPGVLQEFSHILIEFYAPWCGHCKKLAPIYKEVADELKAQGSVVRLAKVDSTENSKSSGTYGVRGYPTLIFFLNGQKVEFNGQRSKDAMVNWLLKRTRDPVSQIDAEKYQALSGGKGVSIVYHGDFTTAKDASILSKYALADDFNAYFYGTDLGKPEGTVEMIRDFDEQIIYEGIDEGIKSWIAKNQRPLVVSFDERTIGDIFSSKKLGAVLFNGANSDELLAAFTEAAKEYSATDAKPLIFTLIDSKNEHLDNFAQYIKINHKQTPLVIIDAGNQNKFVLTEEPTKENILAFFNDHSGAKYGITEEVKAASQEEKQEETAEEL